MSVRWYQPFQMSSFFLKICDILTRLYANRWILLVSFTNNNLLLTFRVQELVAQTEQKESTVESSTEPEPTEDTTVSPKPKKKKKKDKREKESVNDSSLQQTSENNETTVDTMEVHSNSNGHHKEKKKKKKDKRQESDEISTPEVPASDSSGYLSDKTSRKRAAEREDASELMPAAKMKKKNKWFLSQSI